MARTVVIVDDHASFRSGVRALLIDEGFEVVGEAVDGASGMAVVAATRPDLVLLDIHLPDASGFDIIGRLRDEVPGTRIVLVSSRTASDYRDRLAATAAPFISKSDLSGPMLAMTLRERP